MPLVSGGSHRVLIQPSTSHLCEKRRLAQEACLRLLGPVPGLSPWSSPPTVPTGEALTVRRTGSGDMGRQDVSCRDSSADQNGLGPSVQVLQGHQGGGVTFLSRVCPREYSRLGGGDSRAKAIATLCLRELKTSKGNRRGFLLPQHLINHHEDYAPRQYFRSIDTKAIKTIDPSEDTSFSTRITRPSRTATTASVTRPESNTKGQHKEGPIARRPRRQGEVRSRKVIPGVSRLRYSLSCSASRTTSNNPGSTRAHGRRRPG